MPARELLNQGQRIERDVENSQVKTRVFLVEDFAPSEIDWGTDGLPLRFAPHSVGSSVLARDISADEFGDGRGSKVTVVYRTSSNAHVNTSRPEPQPLGAQASRTIQEITHETEIVEIPEARIVEETVSNSSPLLIAKRWVWEWLEVIEVRQVVEVEWKIISPTLAAKRELKRQFNRIHQLPDGDFYRMRSASMSFLSGSEFLIQASWISDDGTRFMTALPQAPEDPRLPGDLAYKPLWNPLPGLTRNPFHQLRIEAAPGDTAITPKMPIMSQRMTYNFEPALFFSWEDLPQFPGF